MLFFMLREKKVSIQAMVSAMVHFNKENKKRNAILFSSDTTKLVTALE